MFKEIKLKIKNDLAKKGKRLPDSDHVPLNLVLDYLKDFGITRKSVLATAAAFE
jgi:hypothetical protein